jgi:hypothetical protein
MTYRLRTKDGRTRTYWVSDSGGYVRLIADTAYPDDTCRRQVCTGLGYTGDTLYLRDASGLAALIRRESKRAMDYDRRHRDGLSYY